MGILEQLRSSGITIIISSSSLDEVIYTINSTLYVLDKGAIVSSGDMLEVLSNDSLLNKVGLELPFMVDLSVKLKYYNLVSKINMSPLGMVRVFMEIKFSHVNSKDFTDLSFIIPKGEDSWYIW